MNAPLNPKRKPPNITGWVLGFSFISCISAWLNFFRFIPSPSFVEDYQTMLFWLTLTIGILTVSPQIRFVWLRYLASHEADPGDNPSLEKAGQVTILVILFAPIALIAWLGLYAFAVFVGPLMTTFAYSEETRVELTIDHVSSRRKCRRAVHFVDLGFWGKELCGVDRNVWARMRQGDLVTAIGVGNGLGIRVKRLELVHADDTPPKIDTGRRARFDKLQLCDGKACSPL